MTATLARALMTLAACCLGESRREWAWAMEAEYKVAVGDGRALAFAMGCLVTAWQEMPRQEEGRFVLANYALALGFLVPMAVLQLQCVRGLPYLSLSPAAVSSMLGQVAVQNDYLAEAHRSALGPLLALWLLLGVSHLRLAWALLERDWSAVVSIGALTVGASTTLVIFAGVLFVDDAGVGVQALLLGGELAAIHTLARWHARIFAAAPAGDLAT